MNDPTRSALTGQYLATLDMLENAMNACPDALWGDASREPQFWYLVYHTLFWTECYLAGPPDEFVPPAPFGLEEMDPAGVMPPRVYSASELAPSLERCRERCRAFIAALTDASALEPAGFPRHGLNRLELVLYTMRHVQHHTAQLNLILRQRSDVVPPGWVGHHREA